MKGICRSLLASVLLVWMAGSCPAAYHDFTTIAYPGANITGAYGNNDLGQVVGEYFVPGDIHPKGFIHAQGNFTTFNVQGATSTTLYGINNAGDLVGAYNGQSAFLFSGGELTPINPPGATGAEARSINKNRMVVGDCLVGGKYKGFKYDGAVTFINYPDAEETRTFGINDDGTIVGKFRNAGSNVWVGFILKNGQTQIIQFPNAVDTRPNGINNSEQIVGYYSYDNNISHGFIYRGGQFTTVDFPGAKTTEVVHINNYGKIVGWYDDDGFLASPPSMPPLSLLLD